MFWIFWAAQWISLSISFCLFVADKCRGILMFTPWFVIETLVEFLRSMNMLKVYSSFAIFIILFSCMRELVFSGF